jgi:ankyrin repeat protein
VKILVKYTNASCITDIMFRKTPLIYAANNGHVEVVRVLLESGADVEVTDNYRRTALHIAASYGPLDMCRLLLDWGAKVDPRDRGEDTPLHLAAQWGYLSAVKLLVERGADVSLKNDYDFTASKKATIMGHNDVADWLESVSRV